LIVTVTIPPAAEVQTLYADHHGWLKSWLRRKLGCSEQAADLAQDTFVRLLFSPHSLSGLKEPRAFLTTTAKRLVIDHQRRERIERAYMEALAVEPVGYAPSAEAVVKTVQAVEQLVRALLELAPKGREAFVRHYLEDESQQAIAERLGISVRMVQKYLAQGLMLCASALTG